MEALFGAWGRHYAPGLQQGYWKGLARMSLADVVRCVDRAIERYGSEADMKLPTVGELWSIKRTLRNQPMPQAKPVENWRGDRWDEMGNIHLREYLYSRDPRRYHPDGTYSHVEHRVTPGPIGTAITNVMLEWKNGWARDMRESELENTLPQDGGKEWWGTNMKRAEEQISKLLEKPADFWPLRSGDGR